MNDVKSLSHSKWRCKYHIVFPPKYRRQVIYNQIKVDIGKILRDLCERKGVEILEAERCPDHIHMLVTILPHMGVSRFMGCLKSVADIMAIPLGNMKMQSRIISRISYRRILWQIN